MTVGVPVPGGGYDQPAILQSITADGLSIRLLVMKAARRGEGYLDQVNLAKVLQGLEFATAPCKQA